MFSELFQEMMELMHIKINQLQKNNNPYQDMVIRTKKEKQYHKFWTKIRIKKVCEFESFMVK